MTDRAKTLLLLSMLFLGTLVSGCKGGESKAIESVKSKIESNSFSAAELELKSILQKNPKSAESRFLLGTLMLRNGNAVAAVSELERARDLKYPENLVLPSLAKALLLAGKAKQVIESYGSAKIQDKAADAEIKAIVAAAYFAEGDSKTAKEISGRILKESPGQVSAQLLQARMEASADNPAKALQLVNSLLKDNANDYDGWALKGDLLAQDPQQQVEAIAAYRQALAIKKTSLRVQFSLASIHLSRGELKEASAQLAAMRSTAPGNVNVGYLDAQLAISKGEFERARGIYQNILRVLPENTMVLVGAAEAELRLGSYQQAEALAAKALALSPSAASARRLLAQAQIRLGQPAKAIATLDPIVDQKDAAADVIALAATAQMLNGNTRASDLLHRRLAKMKPTDIRIRTLVASSQFGSGGNEAAFTELQAISREDKSTSADLVIISARIRNRQYDQALEAIEALEKKDPTRPIAAQLRGIVLVHKRDVAGARKSFEASLSKDPAYLPVVAALAALDLMENKPDTARKRFEELVKRKPNDVNVLLRLSDFLNDINAPTAERAKILDRAIKVDSNNAEAWTRLVQHQLSFEGPQSGLLSAQKAVAALPSNIELQELLGRVQMQVGDTDAALASFGKIAAAYPKQAIGYFGQARAYQAANKLQEAAAAAAKAVELQPDLIPPQRLALQIALQQKRYPQALTIAKAVQTARPNESTAYLMEAEVEMDQSHWDSAAAALRKALSHPDSGDAPARLNYVLERAGKTDAAKEFANDWLKKNPKDTVLRFQLATQASAKGDAQSAERHFRDILIQDPDNVRVLNNIAMLLISGKKPGEAREMAERAVRLSPTEPAILDTLAAAQSLEGKHSEAVTTQQRAISLAPRDGLYRLNLAKIYIQATERQKAKAELEKLIAAGGESPPLLADAKQLLQSLKRW